jgi:hypothetical protein
MEAPVRVLPEIGSPAETYSDILHRNYLAYCARVGVSPSQAVPADRYASRSGGLKRSGLSYQDPDRAKREYVRERSRRRADIDAVLAEL